MYGNCVYNSVQNLITFISTPVLKWNNSYSVMSFVTILPIVVPFSLLKPFCALCMKYMKLTHEEIMSVHLHT